MPEPRVVDEIQSTLDPETLDPRRVLVVGARPSQAVVSLTWEQFRDSEANIADYSVVVLVLDSYDLPGADINFVASALSQRYDRFMAGPQTELVIVGWNPRVGKLISGLGLGLAFEAETGDYITNPEPEFATYLGLVDRYSFLIRLAESRVSASASPLLMAAGRDMLGVAYEATNSSRVVILPGPTKRSLDEGIEVLLSENYGIKHGPTPEPEWLSEITLPEEEGLRTELDQVVAELEPLSMRKSEIGASLAVTRRPLGILYETGEPLETLVRDVLLGLGATGQDHEDVGSHDGEFLTPNGTKIVIEVKGVSGSLKLEHSRQLTDWVSTAAFVAEDAEPEPVKGLLIGNAFKATPLDERAADDFTVACVVHAQREGHCLITTTQLLDALREVQERTFDPAGWWEAVENTSGLFELP